MPTLVEPTATSRCSSSAPASRSSACSWRRWRGAAIGRFVAARGRRTASSQALCHAGANLVPSGRGLRRVRGGGGAEPLADDHRRGARGRRALGGGRRADADAARGPARAARLHDDRAAAGGRHGPAAGDARRPRAAPARLRGRARARSSGSTRVGATRTASAGDVRRQIEEGRSWLWLEDDVILFKAEASAWTPTPCRSSRSGSTPRRAGAATASRGLRDLCRLLLEPTPVVTLFVRTDNAARDRALRVDRHGARALVPEHSLAVKRAFFARHGESEYSVRELLNGDVAVSVRADGRRASSRRARSAALRARAARPLRDDRAPARRRQTADDGARRPRRAAARRAGAERPAVRPVRGPADRGVPGLGGRAPSSEPPGAGGESRHAIVERYARGFRIVLARPEEAILVVAHSLPISYLLGALEGVAPGARAPLVAVRDAVRASRAEELERAAACSSAWLAAPSW